jgi:hypothetical protein
VLQDAVEVGGEECALARLVHHGLAGVGIEILHDVVTGLATDQDAPHRPVIADACLEPAARLLRGRAIGEIGSMAFPRVDDQEPVLARGFEHALGRRHRAVKERDVIAQRFPEAAGLDEVALKVDHEQRAGLRVEHERVGFRLDLGHDLSPRGSRRDARDGGRRSCGAYSTPSRRRGEAEWMSFRLLRARELR